jgi:hypothetical protein
VPHEAYRKQDARLLAGVRHGGVLVDVKGMYGQAQVRDDLRYWSL